MYSHMLSLAREREKERDGQLPLQFRVIEKTRKMPAMNAFAKPVAGSTRSPAPLARIPLNGPAVGIAF